MVESNKEPKEKPFSRTCNPFLQSRPPLLLSKAAGAAAAGVQGLLCNQLLLPLPAAWAAADCTAGQKTV
jgi:hypothetical protein